LDPIWDEKSQRTVEIFMDNLERDIFNSEEHHENKIWINYKILEKLVNDLFSR
jgi:predicted secreted Zn-dependent protease